MKNLSGSRVLRGLTSRRTATALGAVITVAALAAGCSSGSTSGSTTTSGKTGPAWCGKKDFVLGYSDGNGQNGWRKVTLALLKQAVAECPNITKAIYEDALGSAQTQVAQFNSLIAQGANVIVTIPDAGTPLLPVMRKAMAAHIAVIPFTQPPVGGQQGTDYVAAVVENQTLLGKEWGEWMCTTLHKGNVVFMGGVPGNSQSLDELQGIKQAFSQPSCSGVKLLPGAPVTTDWQVAMYQSAMAGLIAKYGNKINGIIVDYGGGFNGAVAAYKAAGLKVPPVATNSDNQLTCSLMKQGDKFIEYTSGNKQVDNALQQGIAAINHTKPLQAALYPQHVVFNTEGGPKPACDPSLPAGAALGEGLTAAQLTQILG
jgi:ribose transport system substrate-binding protein